jgi:hypothetical protein
MPLTRRAFLRTTGAACLATFLPARAEEAVPLEIELLPDEVVGTIARDFIGFGYETSAVANAGFFSVQNAAMLQFYRTLSTQGLIRIGGNVSDYTHWSPHGTLASMPQGKSTVINERVVTDLGDFARTSGWKVMWGLNLGSGTKEEAVAEASAISQALGASLHSFEIGNEVDLLAGGEGRHWKDWNFDAYHARYVEYKAAIRKALPNAQFSGPDSAGKVEWCEKFAALESHDMKLLTDHYYRMGASRHQATMEVLLASDPGLEERARALQAIGKKYQLPYRINETNSFSGGGKTGISDVFGAALWCLDYMFLLASFGCEGVNIQTDVNHLHWLSHYSPIYHDDEGNYQPRPTYYGMLAFAMAAKGRLIALKSSASGINLRAFGTRDETGTTWLTIINKDLNRDALVRVSMQDSSPAANLFRLAATSPLSAENITLAGNPVAADGKWSPGPGETVAVSDHSAKIRVPRASAAFLRFG